MDRAKLRPRLASDVKLDRMLEIKWNVDCYQNSAESVSIHGNYSLNTENT